MKFHLAFTAVTLFSFCYSAPTSPSSAVVKQALDAIDAIQDTVNKFFDRPSVKLQTPLPEKFGEQGEFEWTEAITEKGKAYEVGIPVHATDNVHEHVEWVPDDKWHNTDADFAKNTGITSYNVGHSTSHLWSYYVQVVTSDNYNYKFIDGTGDSYALKIMSPSDSHIVRYNSRNATIYEVVADPRGRS